VTGSVLIREYTHTDLDALVSIHSRRELPYSIPDLESPLFLSKIVIEKDSRIVAASLLRLTAEAYVFLEPERGDARQRMYWLRLIHEAARGDAARKGLDDVHCWVPPGLGKSFGKRIVALGWQRERWDCYSRSLAAATPGL
jgi:hypothetical protein